LFLAELSLLDWKPEHKLTYEQRFSEVVRTLHLDAEYFQPKFQAMFSSIGKGVRLVKLSSLATLIKGIEVGSEAYTVVGIPFWRVSNISKYGMDASNLSHVDEELYQALRRDYEPKQGELLLTKDASPGLAYYLEFPIKGIISSGILRLSL